MRDLITMGLPLIFAFALGTPRTRIALHSMNGAVIVGFALFGFLTWAFLLYVVVFTPPDQC